VKITTTAKFAALAVTGTLALAACGSESSASSTADTGSIAGVSCVSGSLKASGSSAQANAIAEWVNAYQLACEGSTIEYQPNGSGAGIADFINKQTAFAGSDSALKDEDKTTADARCATGPAIDLPAVGGAIVLAINIDGVDDLTLTPAVLAGIFGNTITTWDDPKIKGLNPDAALPSASIAKFHRSDASGTTDNFTKYLIAASGGAWTFPGGKDWSAPGGQGSKGSDGVTSSVKSTANSIGYVELSYAQSAGLTMASIDNGGGAVAPSSDAAAKTISSAELTGSGNDLALSIDYATQEAGAYPIVLVTYEITCEKGGDAATLDLTKSFLTYVVSDEGQRKLTELGYVPIAGELIGKVRAAVSAISA
jgi:phosphate transport system substrate-binding protein